MKPEGKTSIKKGNIAYVVLLVAVIVFMFYWRIFGIEVLDSKIHKGIINYPATAGIAGLAVGVVLTWVNIKEHSASGDSFALFDCLRSILLSVASVVMLICAVTL